MYNVQCTRTFNLGIGKFKVVRSGARKVGQKGNMAWDRDQNNTN